MYPSGKTAKSRLYLNPLVAQDHSLDFGFCGVEDGGAFFAELFCFGVDRVYLFDYFVLNIGGRDRDEQRFDVGCLKTRERVAGHQSFGLIYNDAGSEEYREEFARNFYTVQDVKLGRTYALESSVMNFVQIWPQFGEQDIAGFEDICRSKFFRSVRLFNEVI